MWAHSSLEELRAVVWLTGHGGTKLVQHGQQWAVSMRVDASRATRSLTVLHSIPEGATEEAALRAYLRILDA